MNHLPLKLGLAVSLGLTFTLTLLLAMTHLAAGVTPAHAAEHTVCREGPPSCTFTNVQAAVDVAIAGDVIKVAILAYDITDRKRAEAALKESELRYRTTIDSMADPIHVIDSEFRIVLFNKTLERWNEELGLETKIIGRAVFEVYPFLKENVIKTNFGPSSLHYVVDRYREFVEADVPKVFYELLDQLIDFSKEVVWMGILQPQTCASAFLYPSKALLEIHGYSEGLSEKVKGQMWDYLKGPLTTAGEFKMDLLFLRDYGKDLPNMEKVYSLWGDLMENGYWASGYQDNASLLTHVARENPDAVETIETFGNHLKESSYKGLRIDSERRARFEKAGIEIRDIVPTYQYC